MDTASWIITLIVVGSIILFILLLGAASADTSLASYDDLDDPYTHDR